MKRKIISLCVVSLLMSVTSAFGAAMLTDIGVLDLGDRESQVLAITPDGAYAVGYSHDGAGINQPIIYDAVNGMQALLNPFGIDAEARGIANVPATSSDAPADGVTPCVGIGLNLNNQLYNYKALTTNLTGGNYYPTNAGYKLDVQAPTYNITGSQLGHAAGRWFSTAYRDLSVDRGVVYGQDAPGAAGADMRDTDPGGTVVSSYGKSQGSGYGGSVGYSLRNPGGAKGAIRFTAPNGAVQTPIPGGSGIASEAYGVSATNANACGWDENGDGTISAFKQITSAANMVILPTLAGDTDSVAIDINEAGAAVGYSAGAIEQAVIWDAAGNIALLQAVLNSAGVDTSAWISLTRATTMSDDGLTVGGFGVFAADGSTRGFVATLPEPATLALLGFGGLFLRRRRSV